MFACAVNGWDQFRVLEGFVDLPVQLGLQKRFEHGGGDICEQMGTKGDCLIPFHQLAVPLYYPP